MPTKVEYEEILNEALGVDVRWRKLSKRELEEIAEVLSKPEELLKRLGVDERRLIRKKLRRLLDEVRVEGPLGKLLKRWLEEE